jgi:murein tripeptide amidase MpaA
MRIHKLINDFKNKINNLFFSKPQNKLNYSNSDSLILDPSLEYLGKTFEGRDIVVMRISKNVNEEERKKKSILITGLHHARYIFYLLLILMVTNIL